MTDRVPVNSPLTDPERSLLCWLTIRTIADQMGWSDERAAAALDQLAKRGEASSAAMRPSRRRRDRGRRRDRELPGRPGRRAAGRRRPPALLWTDGRLSGAYPGAVDGRLVPHPLTFGSLTFTAQTLVRLVTISVELYEDADPSAGGMVANAFAQQMAREIDRVALLGSGTAPTRAASSISPA